MAENTTSNNRRIARNSLLLYFRMLIIMIISFYISRTILEELGVEDFGIYNVVTGFVSIFAFISGAMINSTERYLNFHLGRSAASEVRKVFNASRVIHVSLGLIVALLAETLGLWFVKCRMQIPADKLEAALWVFHCSILTYTLVFITYPYNAVIIAREKMKVYAYISIIEALLKLSVAFSISLFSENHLILYGVLLLGVQVFVSVIYRVFCFINFRETQFKINDIPRSLYTDLLSFSGWSLFGSIGHMSLNQGTNILLNLFFGPAVNAAKGISLQVQLALNSFFTNFQMAQNPQIIKSYATGDYAYFHQLIFRSSKFSYYLMLIVTIPILMNTEIILHLWLKTVPEYTVSFVKYALFFSLITGLGAPLITGSQATGNVKKIMTTIALFFWLIIPVGYILLNMGYSPVVIFQVQLSFYIIAHVMRVVIVSSQINFKIKDYMVAVVYPILLVSAVSMLFSILLNRGLNSLFYSEILTLIIKLVFSVGITMVVIYMIGMSRDEKYFVNQFIHKILRR